MQLRGFVALSLCALIGISSPAFAEGKVFSSSLRMEATASAQDPSKVKKSAKSAKEMTPAEKRAAEKKAREAAAKAKAAEKQKLAAKAKAEADRKLAEKKKAEEARKLARAKELAEKKAAAARAAELKKVAKAKAEQERLAARAKALEEKQQAAKAKADAALAAKLAKEKAKEEARLAKLKAIQDADEARVRAAEASRQAELAQLASMDIARTGNTGELRSEVQPVQNTGFLGLFGAAPKASMLPETRALDAALEQQESRRKFRVRPDFEPTTVEFPGYSAGTIVIDTSARYLYLVQSSSKARRYAIAVGREGLQYKGSVTVGDKQEWPRWIPTQEMQKREPSKYGRYKDGMAGGPNNPLGARAIYLYQGKKDTYLRIHGTNQPETIGTDASNGCFRMVNDHVKDLYQRVKLGTQVIVM